MMFTRLKIFFQKHDVFHVNQHGFRENHSTEHAILDLVNQIQTNMDQVNIYVVFLLTYEKHLTQLIILYS